TWAEDTEPNTDGVGRCRARAHPGKLVVLTREAHRPLPGPHCPDHLDRFEQGVCRFAWRAIRAAHRRHRLPERTCTETKLKAAPGQDVEAGSRLGKQRGSAQRQVRDIWEHPYTLGAGKEHRHQRPGVEETSLVWVVLHTNEIEAGAIGELADLE